jgi:exonuclease I
VSGGSDFSSKTNLAQQVSQRNPKLWQAFLTAERAEAKTNKQIADRAVVPAQNVAAGTVLRIAVEGVAKRRRSNQMRAALQDADPSVA